MLSSDNLLEKNANMNKYNLYLDNKQTKHSDLFVRYYVVAAQISEICFINFAFIVSAVALIISHRPSSITTIVAAFDYTYIQYRYDCCILVCLSLHLHAQFLLYRPVMPEGIRQRT